jgi:glycosyltransferase involved in cell wall biosynthesis
MLARIRFECTRYPHWGARSGYAQFVRWLDPQDFQIVLHAASDSDADLVRWLTPLRLLLRRLVRRGRMPWYKLSDFDAEIHALMSCLARRHDIVHFLDGEHSGQFLPRLVRMARLSTIRTVATFHQPPEIAREVVNGELLRWFDQVVLVSPSQLPFFKQHLPEDRLNVILHGVDTEFFRPVETPNPTKRIRCITAGHWLRNWDVFKGVAQAMGRVMFDVVTNRPIGFDGLPNVTIHNGVDDDILAKLYRSADILFLPLLQSTANNALLEGIASGLPVVATDLEGVRAYVPGPEAIRVVGNEIEGFVDALQRLQQDVDLRHEMGRWARARAEELAWSHLARHYSLLYSSLVSPMRSDA